jgi:glutamyl endopeptidase
MTTMIEEFDELVESEDQFVLGKDTRVLVDGRKGGWSTTDSPFRFICQLEFNGVAVGSGTLIGPRTVLTAGHCLHYSDGTLLPKNGIRVIPGRRGDDTPLPESMSKDLAVMKGYESITRTDVGIITLAEPIGDKIGYWTMAHSQRKDDQYGVSILRGSLPIALKSDKVNLSGYPIDRPRGCTTTCGRMQYLSYDYTRKKENGLLYYLNDIYIGHSGCPVWVKRHPSNGGRVMVAINVAAALSVNYGVFIDANVRKFITDNIVK